MLMLHTALFEYFNEGNDMNYGLKCGPKYWLIDMRWKDIDGDLFEFIEVSLALMILLRCIFIFLMIKFLMVRVYIYSS